MKKPESVKTLEALGRVRLSKSFFMREFLYSEISQIEGVANIPDDPELAIASGKNLCENVLEPIQAALGRISIRSAYRPCQVKNPHTGKAGYLTQQGMSNFASSHQEFFQDFRGEMNFYYQ